MTDASTPDDTVLDARDIDGEPFSDIMTALEDLDDEDSLVLVNSFEPTPLYGVLEREGFTHDSEQVGSEEWRIRIEPADG